MHILATMAHLKNACLHAGIPEGDIYTSGFSALLALEEAPAAVIFPVEGEADVHNPAAKTARTSPPAMQLPDGRTPLRGTLRSLLSARLDYHVIFAAGDVDQLERMLVPFFRYLSQNDPVDRNITPEVPLKIPCGKVRIDWVSNHMGGLETATVILPCDAAVYQETVVLPVDLKLTFRVADGNPEE